MITTFALSKAEVYALAKGTDNAQDSVMLALLFEGATLEEAQQATHTDVLKNSITLHNGESLRTLPIPPELGRFIKDAATEHIYLHVEPKRCVSIPLQQTGFILRGDMHGPLPLSIIESRIIHIGKRVGYQNLTAQLLQDSGNLHRREHVLH